MVTVYYNEICVYGTCNLYYVIFSELDLYSDIVPYIWECLVISVARTPHHVSVINKSYEEHALCG